MGARSDCKPAIAVTHSAGQHSSTHIAVERFLGLIGYCYAKPRWWRIGLAAAFVLAAVALRMVLMEGFGARLVYVPLYPAVAIAATLGGASAGITAALLSAVLAYYWSTPISAITNATGVIGFLLSCAFIVATAHAMQVLQGRIIEAQRVSENERQLRSFVQRVPAAIAMFDRDMRYLAASAKWLDTYQLDDGVIGRSHYEVFPDLPERWKRVHQQGLAGEVMRNDDDCFARADGSKQWTKWEMQPWYDGRGEVGGITLYLEDLTAQRQLQDRLALVHRMETIGRLSGGIAHDFNNLLTVVVGNAELLREQLRDRTELRGLAEQIVGAGDRATRLVKHLQALAGQQLLHPGRVDLNIQVRFAIKLLPEAVIADGRIGIVLDPDTPAVIADPPQLESAVVNILMNACEALQDGGRITVTTATVILGPQQTDVRPGQYGMIEITDDGVGMTDQVRSRVFEPFFTTKPFGSSSGLGLSMVYGFAKQSGGHVAIDSRVGSGTTVRLFLPLADAVQCHPRPSQLAAS